ncbi:hypothetical protein [Vibrio taketomensis]|uniref:hypothetical protein n=1 Tax=Vibrio taketomensis TaxID=2572923 RepID=UPI00142EBC53|nr:hypothetical protein [Vibrio taketomensis]
MKWILVLVTVLWIVIATQTQGLYRALAELFAFVSVLSLVVMYRKQKRNSKVVIEAEDL